MIQIRATELKWFVIHLPMPHVIQGLFPFLKGDHFSDIHEPIILLLTMILSVMLVGLYLQIIAIGNEWPYL